MNSTLKSLMFWVVLVVVGVLIWNFSTKYQQHDRPISFSEFMSWADSGGVRSVVIDVPSSRARGSPDSASKTITSA